MEQNEGYAYEGYTFRPGHRGVQAARKVVLIECTKSSQWLTWLHRSSS